MKKEVMLKLSGVLSADTDEEVDVFCPGEYFFVNGKHFVRYEEKIAQDSLGTDTLVTIKFNENSAQIHKKGVVNSRISYLPGKTQYVNYSTEYGDFFVEINTKSLNLYESEDFLLLDLDYEVRIEQGEREAFHIRIAVSDKPEFVLETNGE